jgi:hypothetical protein
MNLQRADGRQLVNIGGRKTWCKVIDETHVDLLDDQQVPVLRVRVRKGPAAAEPGEAGIRCYKLEADSSLRPTNDLFLVKVLEGPDLGAADLTTLFRVLEEA